MTNIDYQPYYYKKSTPKKRHPSSRGHTILVMIVMISFCLTVLSVYEPPTEDTIREYYAVYSDVVNSMPTANSIATLVKMRGGAGYVYKVDEGYAIFTSIYSTYDSAQQVATSLSSDNSNTGVYTLKLRQNLSSDATKILSSTHQAYLTLYELSNQTDIGEVLEDNSLSQIHSIIYDIEDRYDELDSLNASEQSYVLAVTDNQLAYLEDLVNNFTDSSQIRYCYCAILCSQT